MRDILALLRGLLFTYKCKLFNNNIEIGNGLRIYKKLSLNCANSHSGKISIGENCIIDGMIGDSCQHSCITLLGPDAIIRIGDNAKLYAARISAKFQVIIGDNILMQEAGIMDTDYHSIDKNRDTPNNETKEKCQVLIGKNVCIGSRSFITKGVTIGDDVIVAPGSIVAISVKTGIRVIGNPAKVLQ